MNVDVLHYPIKLGNAFLLHILRWLTYVIPLIVRQRLRSGDVADFLSRMRTKKTVTRDRHLTHFRRPDRRRQRRNRSRVSGRSSGER